MGAVDWDDGIVAVCVISPVCAGYWGRKRKGKGRKKRILYVHDKPHLLRRTHRLALHDLRCEMRRKRDQSTRHEAVLMPVPLRVERRAVEQGRQVERGQGVQDDDFVRGVGVDALREREERAGVVEGLVEGGVG